MKDNITILPRRRLAARAAARIARWQQRLSDRMQDGDNFARQAGWSITRTRFGGRVYRDSRFGQLNGTRAPRTPHQTAPTAAGSAPLATGTESRRRASAGRQRPSPPGGIGGGTP